MQVFKGQKFKCLEQVMSYPPNDFSKSYYFTKGIIYQAKSDGVLTSDTNDVNITEELMTHFECVSPTETFLDYGSSKFKVMIDHRKSINPYTGNEVAGGLLKCDNETCIQGILIYAESVTMVSLSALVSGAVKNQIKSVFSKDKGSSSLVTPDDYYENLLGLFSVAASLMVDIVAFLKDAGIDIDARVNYNKQ